MKKINYFLILVVFVLTGLVSSQASMAKDHFFTLDQETYLAKHSHVYAYFSQLYTGEKSPSQIAKEHNLSDEVSRKYLKALEEIGVIEKVNSASIPVSIKFKVVGVSSFDADGPLSKSLTNTMLRQHVERVIKDSKDDKVSKNLFTSNRGLWITQKEYDQYKKDLEKLNQKYMNKSMLNKKSINSNFFRVSSLVSLIPVWEPEVFSDIKKEFN